MILIMLIKDLKPAEDKFAALVEDFARMVLCRLE